MHHHVVQLVEAYGLLAVFIVVGLESMGLPLPGELAVIIAASVASTHDGALLPIILAAASGAIVGDNVGYLLGRKFGKRLLLSQGWRVGLKEDHLKLGLYLFKTYGVFVVFVARFIAVLRVLAAFLAGANALEWRKFLVANALGALLWASAVASLTFWFGRSVLHAHGPISYILPALGIATVVGSAFYVRANEGRLMRQAAAAYPGPIPGFRSGR